MIKLELEVKQIDNKIVVCNDKSNIKKFSTKELYTLVEIIENKLEKLNEMFRLERRKMFDL